MKDYIASTQSTPQNSHKQHQNCNNEDSINTFISDFTFRRPNYTNILYSKRIGWARWSKHDGYECHVCSVRAAHILLGSNCMRATANNNIINRK